MKEKSGILERIRRCHPPLPLLPLPPSPRFLFLAGGRWQRQRGRGKSASSFIRRKRRMTIAETPLATMRRDENWHHD